MEGVAFSFRDCLEIMRGLGVDTREIRGTGGGMKSRRWAEIQANVSGERLLLATTDEGGAAYGAAILSLVGAQAYPSVQEACGRMVRFDKEIRPDPESRQAYEKYFQFYRSLYPVPRGRYEELAALP